MNLILHCSISRLCSIVTQPVRLWNLHHEAVHASPRSFNSAFESPLFLFKWKSSIVEIGCSFRNRQLGWGLRKMQRHQILPNKDEENYDIFFKQYFTSNTKLELQLGKMWTEPKIHNDGKTRRRTSSPQFNQPRRGNDIKWRNVWVWKIDQKY